MISCHDAARFFLSRVDEDAGDLMSHLKLQKLVYYAQGLHLALYGEPLFAEPIASWEHGPVAPKLYEIYEQYRGGAIPIPPDIDWSVYDNKTYLHLEQVYYFFGRLSAWQLREMTHQEKPWKNTPHNAIIKRNLIKSYFEEWLKNNPGKIEVVSDAQQQLIAKEFEILAEEWYDETCGCSFVAEKISHPAYQKIIDMGPVAVPLLLGELEKEVDDWFDALEAITGANPIKLEQRGRMKLMAEAWLQWGKEHGYKW